MTAPPCPARTPRCPENGILGIGSKGRLRDLERTRTVKTHKTTERGGLCVEE